MKNSIRATFFALYPLIAVSCGPSVQNGSKTGYSGKDMTDMVAILRDKETKSAAAEISKNIEWSLFAGPSVDSIDFSAPCDKGDADGLFPLDVPRGTRSYFQFVSPRGSAIVAERHLPMAGGYNFRDLGGFRTRDGRYVKWGKFIRSDDMHSLTGEDLAYLSSIPLVSVVDFRSEKEIAAAPDRLPDSVTGVFAYSINPGDVMSVVNEMIETAGQGVEIMALMNAQLVTNPEVVSQYRKFFELLQEEENIPLLFHCSAGKDRTGMASALVLFALGVDEKTIKEDYMASNTYLSDKYAAYIAERPEHKPLMEVQPQFLQAGLDAIKKNYGSVDKFLTETLGVDVESFRDKYLY